MHILIPYYSRSGYTEKLAHTLATELGTRGHQVVMEKEIAVRERNKWLLVPPLLSLLSFLPLYLLNTTFRHGWLKHYRQHQQAILPLTHHDASRFDVILPGGPKWLYLSYPLARYLNTVTGLQDKKSAPSPPSAAHR